MSWCHGCLFGCQLLHAFKFKVVKFFMMVQDELNGDLGTLIECCLALLMTKNE